MSVMYVFIDSASSFGTNVEPLITSDIIGLNNSQMEKSALAKTGLVSLVGHIWGRGSEKAYLIPRKEHQS